jgi:hypothetical protein
MAQKKRSSLALMGQALIQNLQQQGRYERALARFRQQDDDTTYPPDGDPLDSAQSRHSMPVVVH